MQLQVKLRFTDKKKKNAIKQIQRVKQGQGQKQAKGQVNVKQDNLGKTKSKM